MSPHQTSRTVKKPNNHSKFAEAHIGKNNKNNNNNSIKEVNEKSNRQTSGGAANNHSNRNQSSARKDGSQGDKSQRVQA